MAIPRHLTDLKADLAHLLPAIGGRRGDPAPHHAPAPGTDIGQGWTVQLHRPRHLRDVGSLVATALGCVSPLKCLRALRLQGTVIDPLMDVAAVQRLVDVFGPGRPPVHQQLLGVPVAVLGPEPLGANLAGGQHDVGVMVALVSLTPRSVKGDVSDHPSGDELCLGEPAHQIAVLLRR